MTAAARVQPEDFFTPEEWARVSARSSWKGIALVLHAWAVIGLAIWVGVMWPITIPFVIMVVGNRQLGLNILMHDAAHALLHENLSRLRNIAEHALIVENGTDPLRHARTTYANWLERAFVAPYWVNYHCEHHMFTQIPCWNLPKAHQLLVQKGVTSSMEIQSSYPIMLKLATAG